MKIEVNDYVRCKNGRIAKIKAIENNFIYFDGEIYRQNGTPMFECETCFSDFIVKHSKNIIDLIEVGDYVNGIKVCKINEPSLANEYKRIVYCNESEGLYEGIFKNDDIKSILTKQQMEAIQYVVE